MQELPGKGGKKKKNPLSVVTQGLERLVQKGKYMATKGRLTLRARAVGKSTEAK